MKKCTHRDCPFKTEQPKEAFHKHNKANDGLGSNCKTCQRRLNRPATKKWKLANPAKNAAARMKYHATKLQRTPKWLTALDLDHIRLFYEAASFMSQETGVKFQVDHVLPLRGEEVSGLHVPLNLQVITAEENVKKWNKT